MDASEERGELEARTQSADAQMDVEGGEGEEEREDEGHMESGSDEREEEDQEQEEEDEEAQERLMLAEAKKLVVELKQNPWRGSDGALSFMRLTELYRHLGEYEKLNRTARRLCAYCPVGEDFLLSWLDEEKRLARLLSSGGDSAPFTSSLALSREQHSHVARTFRLARFVLPSVSLALAHLRFEEASCVPAASLAPAFAAAALSPSARRRVSPRDSKAPGASDEARDEKKSRETAAAVASSRAKQKVRELFEEALDDFALHALDGPFLWAAYRHFEGTLLDALRGWREKFEAARRREDVKGGCRRDRGGAEGAEEERELDREIAEQMQRIHLLFCRQLRLPLAGLGDLLDEYRLWDSEVFGSPPDPSVSSTEETRKRREWLAEAEAAHAVGLAVWKQERKDFEIEVQSALDDDQANRQISCTERVWKAYVASERRSGDPRRFYATTLRALEELGSVHLQLWRDSADALYSLSLEAAAQAQPEESQKKWSLAESWCLLPAEEDAPEDEEESAATAGRCVGLRAWLLEKELVLLQRGIRHFPRDTSLWTRYIQCAAEFVCDAQQLQTIRDTALKALNMAPLSLPAGAGPEAAGAGSPAASAPEERRDVEIQLAFAKGLVTLTKRVAARASPSGDSSLLGELFRQRREAFDCAIALAESKAATNGTAPSPPPSRPASEASATSAGAPNGRPGSAAGEALDAAAAPASPLALSSQLLLESLVGRTKGEADLLHALAPRVFFAVQKQSRAEVIAGSLALAAKLRADFPQETRAWLAAGALLAELVRLPEREKDAQGESGGAAQLGDSDLAAGDAAGAGPDEEKVLQFVADWMPAAVAALAGDEADRVAAREELLSRGPRLASPAVPFGSSYSAPLASACDAFSRSSSASLSARSPSQSRASSQPSGVSSPSHFGLKREKKARGGEGEEGAASPTVVSRDSFCRPGSESFAAPQSQKRDKLWGSGGARKAGAPSGDTLGEDGDRALALSPGAGPADDDAQKERAAVCLSSILRLRKKRQRLQGETDWETSSDCSTDSVAVAVASSASCNSPELLASSSLSLLHPSAAAALKSPSGAAGVGGSAGAGAFSSPLASAVATSGPEFAAATALPPLLLTPALAGAASPGSSLASCASPSAALGALKKKLRSSAGAVVGLGPGIEAREGKEAVGGGRAPSSSGASSTSSNSPRIVLSGGGGSPALAPCCASSSPSSFSRSASPRTPLSPSLRSSRSPSPLSSRRNSGVFLPLFAERAAAADKGCFAAAAASAVLSPEEIERATRATWDGRESADPALAPPVPPSSPKSSPSLLPASGPSTASCAAALSLPAGGRRGGASSRVSDSGDESQGSERARLSAAEDKHVSAAQAGSAEDARRASSMPPPPFTPRRQGRKVGGAREARDDERRKGSAEKTDDEARTERKRGGPEAREGESTEADGDAVAGDACREEKRRKRGADREGRETGESLARQGLRRDSQDTEGRQLKPGAEARSEEPKPRQEAKSPEEREHEGVVPRRGKHIHQLRAAQEATLDAVMGEAAEGRESLPRDEEAARAAAFMAEVDESRTVWVSNLDESVSEQDLLFLFKSQCRGLTAVRLVQDFRRRSKGFAYVDFETPALAAEAASRMHGTKLHERAIKVLVSHPTRALYEEKTLFLSQISDSLQSEEDVKSALESLGFADVTGVRLIREAAALGEGKAKSQRSAESHPKAGKSAEDVAMEAAANPREHPRKHKGYGYVDFLSHDAAVAALQFFLRRRKQGERQEAKDGAAADQGDAGDAMLFGGKPFMLAPSIPMKKHRWILAPPNKASLTTAYSRLHEVLRREQEIRKEAPVDATTIFVKNLAFSVDEEGLSNHFASLCNVTPSHTVVCRDGSGKSRGFGFVKFEKEADALAAMLANDSNLSGRCITVSRSMRSITTPEHPSPRAPAGGGAGARAVGRQRPGLGYRAASHASQQRPRLALAQTERKQDPETPGSASRPPAAGAGDGGENAGEARAKVAEKGAEKGAEGEKKKTNADFRRLFLSGGL
ncbi:hypothetical protein BESB_024890 [Besnoitia besnoiti]|uniref:RRM domain-containing protein n=1 Tax=Besnoitia besnoiti TaxID=94643 RepID=A0A2A9M794_BESBE|nr:uncharacterized protein BESB_024890 [Besnoitia besnoiti]PFH31523.1 hypothetical protein BESB_024890 [Besnoitia besnoiti]